MEWSRGKAQALRVAQGICLADQKLSSAARIAVCVGR